MNDEREHPQTHATYGLPAPLDELTAFRTHHLAETARLTREVLELRAELAQAKAATPAPVVLTLPVADAEALATALQGVVDGYSSALISYDAERLKNVLAAYRSRHPAPKEPLP